MEPSVSCCRFIVAVGWRGAAQVSSFNDHAGTSTEVTVPDKLASGSAKEKRRWEYFAYVMTAVATILLVVIVFMRQRIRIAIAIVREASGMSRCLGAYVSLRRVRLSLASLALLHIF
jgi:hypothetical protein